MMTQYRFNGEDDNERSKARFATEPRVAPQGGVMAMVLAGGRGERLQPLTDHRPKPAVPFGGAFRLIDFVLGNLVNSGVTQIDVLVQYQSELLVEYLERAWAAACSGCHLTPRRPTGNGRGWYLGTADAVYQNRDLIRRRKPDLVLVFGSDHIYTMDIRPMIQWHLETRADVTVSMMPMAVSDSAQFGTASTGPDGRIHEFLEKSAHPKSIPGRPGETLVSMGNYIFKPDVLLEALAEDAGRPRSRHDFGRDVIPALCPRRRVFAYDYRTNAIPGLDAPTDYWRDVGTLGTFHQANLDLIEPFSQLRVFSELWPLRPPRPLDPPAHLISRRYGDFGLIKNSLVAGSALIDGAFVRDSVIGPQVRILGGAMVEESVILGEAVISDGARVRRAIIDQGNVINEGDRIGFDPRSDETRFHRDEESGIVVVPYRHHPQGLELWPDWSSSPDLMGMTM